ncbi:MAG: hypothetical protein ACLFQM_12765 [Fidelibacterota bacterium]
MKNFVFHRYLDKYPINEINFWRTQKKQEVDFIIEGKTAWEVKYNQDQFNEKHYKYFKSKYLEIILILIHLENAIDVDLGK